MKKSLVFRFWDKFDRPKTGCWLWRAGKNGKGYGSIGRGGYGEGGHSSIEVHRLSWMLFNGPIPDGLCVLHKCDNPICVNPEHLFLGTKGDNANDRDEKGRVAHGEKHYKAKLTKEQVKRIRQLHLQGVKVIVIAKLFSVSKGHVSEIVSRKVWKRM